MLSKLLPILLALIGLGGGVGAGLALRPTPQDHPAEPGHGAEATAEAGAHGEAGADADTGGLADGGHATGEAAAKPSDLPPGHAASGEKDSAEEGETASHDYVKLNNQFVIPVVEDGRVSAMVILSLSLEVTIGNTETVYAREPKLRDTLLQVLFDHANTGGFRGAFTESNNMVVLRDALREAAIKTLGSLVSDVLIIDMARQDL